MKPTVSKRVQALPPPAEGSDDEISSATEISNDREKDMCVEFKHSFLYQ
jgi:hypothetical protein